MDESVMMTAEQVMSAVKDGDDVGWSNELRQLWTNHRDQLLTLMDLVLAEGFKEPILLGRDGRLWDGHHRVAVAAALGIMVPTEQSPPCVFCDADSQHVHDVAAGVQ